MDWHRIGPAADYTVWYIEPGMFCVEVSGRLSFEGLLGSIKLMQPHPGWREPYYLLLDLLAHPDYDRGLLSVRRDPNVPPSAAMAVLTKSVMYRMVAASAALASRAVNGTRVSVHDSIEGGLDWLRKGKPAPR